MVSSSIVRSYSARCVSVPFCEDVVDENVLTFENAVEDRP